jgi:hypothetical protein
MNERIKGILGEGFFAFVYGLTFCLILLLAMAFTGNSMAAIGMFFWIALVSVGVSLHTGFRLWLIVSDSDIARIIKKNLA